MKTNKRRAGGFTLVELLVVIAIIAALAGLATPAILGARKRAAAAEATSNLKQINLVMMDFIEDYYTYPSQQILQDNSNRFKNASSGNTANDLLGLLIASGKTQSEEIFFAKGGSRTTRKPDNVFNSASKMLEAGECGFGYVMLSGNVAMSPDDNSSRPILVAPLKANSGGSSPEFNDNPYSGRAVYLRIDGAVKQDPIDPDSNEVLLSGNRTLFETGQNTVWDDDNPDVKAPK